MLTLLTATGCRPESWAITEKLAMSQTYQGPVRWIIVDDGEMQQPITFKRDGWTLEVIRPQPFWKSGDNTQARNLSAGLDVIGNERLVIWEDDDYYAAQYLANVNKWLDTADLVGESHARYYNVKTRQSRQLSNSAHASLCSTAMKGDAINTLRNECKPGVKFIDINLWRNFDGTKKLYQTKTVVGIKGMPGRTGIGMGHRNDFVGRPDRNGAIIRSWLGNDARLYR